ncbi:MAG: hypothetical protein KAV82_07780 [Phycisphaerae bacterium]|nr:hypothetical protein [Phycisphaerae bacterium]
MNHQYRLFIFIPLLSFALAFQTSLAFGRLSTDDIAALQAQGAAEGWTFTVGENPATKRPLNALCGLTPPKDWEANARFDPCTPSRSLPASFDWCAAGKCTPIRNQGSCGSCWAFATVAPLESNILIHDGVTVDLSEQWLVNCNANGWDCGGGWWAHDYHHWKPDPCGGFGAVTEADYPYVAQYGACGCPYGHPYLIDSWAYIGSPYGVPSTNAIKQAVIDYGPVTVAVRANTAMQGYTGGVFNSCSTGSVNHGVVIVGWDDNQGTNGVWLVRNSWGSGWGESGYMRIEYGCSSIGYGACYVVYQPSGSNHAPILSLPQVLPASGQADTTVFEFFVHYYDADGDPPHESYRKVYISGGHGGTMTRVSGSASNGTYRYATTLPCGYYSYFYTFCDTAYQCDQTPWLDGPSVYIPGDVPIQFNIHAAPRTTCLELQYSLEGSGYWEDLPIDDDQIEIAVPAGSELWIDGGECCPSHECYESAVYVNGSHIGSADCSFSLTLSPSAEYVEIDMSWDYHHELTYQVAGTVLLSGGTPVPGGVLAVLTSSQEEQTQVSTDGTFSFDAQGGVPVSVAFSATGHVFNPPILTFPNHCADEAGLEVTARSADVLVPTVYLDTVPPSVTVASVVSFAWIGQDDVSDPANLQYRYMLDGYDADWSSWSSTTSAAYDLPNGVYTFLVTVKDEADNENAAPERYAFVVNAAPQVTNTERISRSVWATRVTLYMPPAASHPTDVVVLLPEHAPDANDELVPVRIYDSEAGLVGANEIVASILGLLPASLSEADQGWVFTLPDPVSADATVQYDIVWGNVAYFGWKPFVTLPDGFPNGRNGGYIHSAYLDENLTVWRNASKNYYHSPSACDQDGWVFEDAVTDDGFLMSETTIRYVLGECWGGDTGTSTEFWGRRTFEWASHICSFWDSEKYTYDGSTDLYEDGFGFSCFDPDGPPFVVSAFDSSYYDRASINLPRWLICDLFWVAAYHSGGPDRYKAWFLALDNNGTEVVPKTFFEDFQHPNYHGLSSLQVRPIGAGVLLLWERYWETDNGWERQQILYQVRDCAGNLVVATTVLTPVEDDSVEIDDEYDIGSTLPDQSGKVWVSYEHYYSGTECGYFVLNSAGGIWKTPTLTPAEREFRYCDRDGSIWVHNGGDLLVLDENDTEIYEHSPAAYYPTQHAGLIAAAVEQNGSGYRLYDRWYPQYVSLDVPAGANTNAMDLFALDLWDNDLHPANLTLDINGSSVPFPGGPFTGHAEVDVTGLLNEGLNLLTMTQDDFLGGQVLTTFPYIVCLIDDDCDDGVSCTIDTCDVNSNACVYTPDDSACSNGLFCDGDEWCDPVNDCQPGTAPDCADTVDCTVDTCDPVLDECVHTASNGLCVDPDYPICDPEVGCVPPPEGACCRLASRGCLEGVTQTVCDSVDGFFVGPGTNCTDGPPTSPCDYGACCLPGECVESFRVECPELGGDFHSNGTVCDPNPCPGACCQSDGTCDETAEYECSGTWLGQGTSCSASTCLGACCFDEVCIADQSRDGCVGSGGLFAGYGSDCSHPDICVDGACCIGDVCLDNPESNCVGSGGYWLGLFTHCDVDTCVACVTGDANADGDVDLGDFAAFQICFDAAYAYPCDCVDIDNDSDVDLDDYLLFEGRLTGPSGP